MSRLIEVQNSLAFPTTVTLRSGDLLLLQASGGHVRIGPDVVELLGPFLPGLLQTNGDILSPMGAPNTVLFRAFHAGRAQVEVFTGDPWHNPERQVLEVTVVA